MNITEIRITKLEDSKALGIASIVIDSDFVVTGLSIYNGKNGLWVSMPSRKNKSNEYKDIAYPITKSAREQIQTRVLAKFQELDREDVVPSYAEEAQKREQAKLEITEEDLPF